MKILVVDDHTLFRRSFIQLLKSQIRIKGLFVEANNGLEALEFIRKVEFDLIFLDIGMPMMNGFETIQEMKLAHPLQKIIVLTQHDEHNVVSYFVDLGASFLTKTANVAEIAKAIRAVSRGLQYIQSTFPKQVKLLNRVDRKKVELTSKERKLIQLLGTGRSSKEIANDMGLKAKSIETYRERLFKKTQVKNVAELMSFAFRNGVMTGS